MIRPPPHAPPGIRDRAGFTVLELLVAVAIAGVVLSLAVVGGRRILVGQEQRSALTTVQQSVWQGATAAAARGRELELVIAGPGLVLRFADDASVVRTFELPADVSFNLENDDRLLLRFTPPGTLDPVALAALPDPLVVTTGQGEFVLTLSVIGEVRYERRSS